MGDRTKRPDLAAVEVFSDTTDPSPYLSHMILPTFPVAKKIGNMYFVTVDADVAAQTGRTLGDAPTRTLLASQSDVFNCTEDIKRVGIPDDEIELMGGLLKAEEKAARVGKRSIMRSKEDKVVTLITAGAGATADILGSLRGAVDVGMKAVERVSGALVLVCSFTAFRRMTRYQEITNTLLRTGIMGQDPRDVRNVNPGTLASVLGVPMVLVGSDDHWAADEAFLLKLPSATVDPDEMPQIGRTVQYLPSEDNPFLMESFFDDVDIVDTVDTRSWYDQELYNASGIYRLTGIDEGNAITTT